MREFQNYIPIPKEFWSLETGETFKICSSCGTNLMAKGENYLIEKALKKKETIYEYAMCFNCYVGVQEQLSEKSKRLIENYFNEHVDVEQRRDELLQAHGRRTRSWLARCMIKGTPRWKCDEYQIYGWFVDEDLVFTGLPYMLSGEVVNDLMQLLSNETLGVLNDLSDKLFGIDLPQGLVLI